MTTSAADRERALFRALNAWVEPAVRAGWFAPGLTPGLIVLETRGVRTGVLHRVPLMATVLGEIVVVSTVRGERSHWVRNLAAADGGVGWWVRGRRREGHAVVLRPRMPVSGRSGDDDRAIGRLVEHLAPATAAGWSFALLIPGEEEARLGEP
ncbi:MAG: nitroreductase family deazaflavin-dependent oxidoreductase [Chloroflexi bacterium]|nr:nitroreductase family deazaflavin-dependent oxidoreductase [Chloroflexota bacterium]